MAGRSSSRRSFARACRDPPTATGCGRGPCRGRSPAARRPSAQNCLGSAAPAGGSSNARRGPWENLHRHPGLDPGSACLPAPSKKRRRIPRQAREDGPRQMKKPGRVLRGRASSPQGHLVGAGEAPAEDARACFALVLALEQGALAALVAPALLGLLGGHVEDDPVTLDLLDRRAHQGMMRAAALGIALGQDQPVAGGGVDRADMLAVAADDFHMLADLAQHLTLALPPFAPAREVILEARPVLAGIVLIVAVELVELACAPLAIMAIVMGADPVIGAAMLPPFVEAAAEIAGRAIGGTLAAVGPEFLAAGEAASIRPAIA